MKKRVLALVSVLLMLAMLTVPFTALADEAKKEAVEVTIGSMSAAQGDEIEVPVTVDKNPGIWGINWKIYYDSQVLRFDKVEFSDDFASLGILDSNEVKYPIVINGMGDSVTENVETTGVIATLHFKVYVGVALGDTEITMRADVGNNINVDAEDIELKVNKGVITVTEGLVSSDNKDDYPPEKPLQEKNHVNTPVGHSDTPDEGGFKWWWFIIGAVILVAVVVVIWLFSGSDDEETTDEGANSVIDTAAPEMPDAPSKMDEDEAAFLKMLADAEANDADEQQPKE